VDLGGDDCEVVSVVALKELASVVEKAVAAALGW
jgi:hypothetical protein